MKRHAKALTFAAPLLAGALGLGLGFSALSAVGDSTANPPKSAQPVLTSPAFPVNKQGQTYGSVPETWQGDMGQLPDLVEVIASNGEIGYMPKEIAFPSPAGSPEEASKLSQRSARVSPTTVYASDGRTIIGEFVIG